MAFHPGTLVAHSDSDNLEQVPTSTSFASFTSLRSWKTDKSSKKSRDSDEVYSLEFPAPPTSPVRKWRRPRKHQKSLSLKALESNKRARAGSNTGLQHSPTQFFVTPDSVQPDSTEPEVFELAETSPRGLSTTRPRHVPIVIPKYDPLARNPTEETSASESICLSTGSDSPSISCPPTPAYETAVFDPTHTKPRYVEICIPTWAQPLLKQPKQPPRVSLNQSTFIDTLSSFEDATRYLSLPEEAYTYSASSIKSDMDNTASSSEPSQMYANNSNSGSRAQLSSANSSQTSLNSRRDEYESASEAESNYDDHTEQGSQSAAAAAAQQTPAQSTSHLSGLVCNVHRTTGKEPPPLVGATTTVLGDKLYVFGGRRLSRSRPQLTSTIYELDLIKRHWTRLEATGDIPLPRYFHSVCALGDTKLVCYGGMSPAPIPDQKAEGQSEVIVMSDVHIYDAPTKVWTKIHTAESPQGRYAHCAAILPSSAVFTSSNAPVSALQHNPSGSNPNQGSLGVSVDGTGGAEMVVVGGQDSANHYIEQVSIFNLRSLKWTGTTGMGRSCGAYRSVVTPLTTMSASQIGAGPHGRHDMDEDDEDSSNVGSGAPMLIYSNYNFLDVKLELQVRLTDGTLTEKPMQTGVSPPGLRFPNGGIIDNHFVVSGTFLTSSKQEYALWALDLRTLTWSRIDAGGSIFSQGSWNRGVLWSRRNAFIIIGNRKRSLVDDYNNRRLNFSNMCVVELEAFGLYENTRRANPFSGYISASMPPNQPLNDISASGRLLLPAAEDLGIMTLGVRELADMDFLAIDGTRVPVNSRLISRRWGHHFTNLLKESLAAASDTDSSTLRVGSIDAQSRNSSITITPSINSASTTLVSYAPSEVPDTRSAPPATRPRLFYLPHTAPTLKALLHYLYTSTLPSPPSVLATPQIFCSLLQLARPYKIDGLLEAVVERLHETLDGGNAAAIFNAAAMGAGGGHGVLFASNINKNRESVIPLRTASLAGIDALANGVNRGPNTLRVDTNMANGRNTPGSRNTLRPINKDDEPPTSARTDGSTSESELHTSSSRADLATGDLDGGDGQIWDGVLSAVVGLQKRGLRGLMEGRRMRDRGRSDAMEGSRVGLGIA